MSRTIHRWLLLALLALPPTGCKEEGKPPGKPAEEVRIEREVERRVAADRQRAEARDQRLRTLRIVGFMVLSGGALGTLIWCGWPRDTASGRSPSDLFAVGRTGRVIRQSLRGGRVIDTRSSPHPPPSDHETPRHP